MSARDLLAIGQVAARTGLSVSAIRFYEEAGLVAPMRNNGGQRRFLRADNRRLSFIRIAQQLGFTLEDVRAQLAALPNGRTPTKADWTRLSTAMRGVLDERIVRMERLRDRLDGCIGCGCLSLKSCAIYNPDDEARARGSGARWVLGERNG
ncbi:redox-sensitive transcriptional activator SoxR [Pacificimonas sp. WHA3]|uniref:Redox-sensitive transcriptional activator SoxR n=1 Tax=Pacificimonas pallii TaxID=2827236 RepID=A0ABS6SDX2_9SPHN|nr:redox-sensitive transcriptional activator SoxR [Pacificimonas pallii]MBV7256052.1 redox-sensitive transcriptional activator SoxR [Pacificimonas pallii]